MVCFVAFCFQMHLAKVLVTVSEGIDGERVSEYTHMQL